MAVRRSAALLLALLAVLAPIVGFVAVGSVAAVPEGMVTIPDDQITETGIPDSENDWLDITGPELLERARGDTMASVHADTLRGEFAVVNTKTGRYLDDNAVQSVLKNNAESFPLKVVINATDDTEHEGREVALPTSILEDIYGHTPEAAYGIHEDGSRWQDEIEYGGGWATWRVPKFSTNTITFDGTYRYRATPAADGAQFTYDIADKDAADNYSIDLTGVDNTEADSVSGSNLADSDTMALDVAGTDPATGASVTFEGYGFGTQWNNQSGTGLSPSGSASISVSGNLDPNGPSTNGEPVLEVTAHGASSTYNPLQTWGSGTSSSVAYFVGDQAASNGGDVSSQVGIKPDTSGDINSITINSDGNEGSDYGATVEVRIATGTIDSTIDGTVVQSSWDPDWTTGDQTINFDSAYTVTSGNNYHIEFVTTSTDGDETNDVIYLNGESPSSATDRFNRNKEDGNGWVSKSHVGDVSMTIDNQVKGLDATADSSGAAATFGDFTDGETKSKELDVTTSDTSINFNANGGNSIDYTLKVEEREGVDSPGIDVDGDGTDEASHSGVLLGTDSSTKSLPDLALSDDTATISATDGAADVTVDYTEHTETFDPTVEVNGQTTSYTGTLSAGSSTSLTTDSTWLSDTHKNRVNITVGDGTLSADAPTPQVDIDYLHDIQDDVSVSFDDEEFTSRYNFTRTYASSRSQSNVSVPFAKNVIGLRGDVEARINGTSWSTVSTSNYWLNGNDLEVDLDAVYTGGDDIPPGTTIDIRADASKVKVNNGAITVTSATTAANDLDTDITLDSWAPATSYISLGGTDQGKEIHYTRGESWSGADEYAVIEADGTQKVFMPNAGDGATLTMRTIPVEVKPQTGEAKLSVDNPDSTEPVFQVEPGASSDDAVKFTFVSAADGQYYELYSKTNDNVRDAGTASSPLTLEDDDSDELLIFREALKNAGAISGGGGGGGQVADEPSSTSIPLVILALVGGLVVVGIVQWRTDVNPISAAGEGARDAGSALASRPRALAVVLVLGFGLAVFTGIIPVPESALVVLLVAGGGLVSYLALQRTGNYSHTRFALLVGGIAFGALVATGQLAVVFDTIGTPGTMLVVVGVLWLAWRTIKRTTRRRQIIFRGD